MATEWRVEEVESFDNLSACAPCHAGLTDFNRMSRADYDGDGVVEGVQTEVRGLLDVLGQMIVLIDDVDDEYPDEVTEERCDPDDDTGLTYPQPGRVPSPTVWVDGSNVGVSRRADFCLSSDDVLLAGTFGRGAWLTFSASFWINSKAILDIVGTNADDMLR